MARITFEVDPEVNKAFRVRIANEGSNITQVMRQLCNLYILYPVSPLLWPKLECAARFAIESGQLKPLRDALNEITVVCLQEIDGSA